MKLQMVADLNLGKAVTIARQSEAVQQQQGVFRGKAGIVDSVEAHKEGTKQAIFLCANSILLPSLHRNKHVQGVVGFLLTLDKVPCK